MSNGEFWGGHYIGDEFPEFYGRPIIITNSLSEVNFPAYKIRFKGESNWYDNMDAEDWTEEDPNN